MSLNLDLMLHSHSEPLASTATLPKCVARWLSQGNAPERLLWHQVATFERLAHTPVVYNTSATGTGKTLASQLSLLREPSPQVTVVIAPTNALVAQHAADWTRFCRSAGLPHRVEGVDAGRLRALFSYSEGSTSNARRLFELVLNHQNLFGDAQKRPLVLVTNPDLFYLSTFFQYPRAAHRAAEAFLNHVDYLVVDEFHYYSGLQLVAFFFVMGLWHLVGRFSTGHRRVCLLTATPDPEVEQLLNALRGLGLDIDAIDPADAPSNAERAVSLAPCRLRLESAPCSPSERIGEQLSAWVSDIKAGQDCAALMDSLLGVSLVYEQLAPQLGGQVRRITGPTPASQRRDAEAAALILATPTVDLGYNFRGRDPNKTRQPLDRLIFEAPTRPRFWQRLGRAGRVLRAHQRDIPSFAVALLPTAILRALNDANLHHELPRDVLADALDECGDEYREWRVMPLLDEWAAMAIAHPLDHIRRRASPESQPVIDRLFETLASLFGEEHRSFSALRAELRAVDEAREIRRTGTLQPRHQLRWLRRGHTRLENKERAEMRAAMVQAKPEIVRLFAAEAVARYDQAMHFRGAGRLGLNVLAWDTLGLYADRPAWVHLSLEECVGRTDFVLLDTARCEQLGLPDPPDAYGQPATVLLRGRQDPRRVLNIVRVLDADERSRDFMGGLQADASMALEATFQTPGRPTAPLPEAVTRMLDGQPLVYFLPWPQHLNALRDMAQARALWEVRFVFIDQAGTQANFSGFICQHAVIAHSLVMQLINTRRTRRG